MTTAIREKKQTVNMPAIEFEGNAADYLVDFYKALGWNTEHNLDPACVRINKDQWLEICDQITKHPENTNGHLTFMNSGPSGNESVPYGKVELMPGWTQTA